jgi:UrcA family protein
MLVDGWSASSDATVVASLPREDALIRNLLLALGCAVAFAAPAAMASDRQDAVRVVYRDLDLSNARDSAVLLHRLHVAALAACGASDFSVPDYRRAVEHSACYRDSMDRAVAAVGAPAVTQIYNGRTFAAN